MTVIESADPRKQISRPYETLYRRRRLVAGGGI